MEFIWLNVQIQTAPIHKTELLRCQQLFRISFPALISSILVIFCHGKLVNKHNEEKTHSVNIFGTLCEDWPPGVHMLSLQ